MEDGQLEAVVLEEPHLGVVHAEVEAVRRRRRVDAGDVPLCDAVAKHEEAAGLVRRLGVRVLDPVPGASRRALPPDGVLHHALGLRAGVRRPRSRPRGTSSRRRRARRRSTPSSSSSARRCATWTTAPHETPANIASCSSRLRTPRERLRVRDEHLSVQLARRPGSAARSRRRATGAPSPGRPGAARRRPRRRRGTTRAGARPRPSACRPFRARPRARRPGRARRRSRRRCPRSGRAGLPRWRTGTA